MSVVVAYYPSTSFVKDAGTLVRRFKVPVLVLAGERRDYDQDAWKRTLDTLRQYQPLPK